MDQRLEIQNRWQVDVAQVLALIPRLSRSYSMTNPSAPEDREEDKILSSLPVIVCSLQNFRKYNFDAAFDT